MRATNLVRFVGNGFKCTIALFGIGVLVLVAYSLHLDVCSYMCLTQEPETKATDLEHSFVFHEVIMPAALLHVKL